MRRAFVILGLAAAAVSLGAAGGNPMVELMKTEVDPASMAVFAVQGDVDPGNEDAAKVPAARWAEGEAAAAKLKAAADRMLGPPLGLDEALWKAEAGKMAEAASAAQAAAASHDGAKFSDAANALGDTCSACHAKYKPQG